MSAFRETANAWLFIAFGFIFMAMSYISVRGLRASKFTENENANAYIALAIIFIIMFLLGRVYFVKLKAKQAQKTANNLL